MAKQVLGKGLGALMKASSLEKDKVLDIAIEEIVPSPLQPRKTFAQEELKELSISIKSNGIIQPLIARIVDGKYELIAGERRLRASQLIKLTHLPVIVRDATDSEVLEMALIENIQRADLNPIEEALSYQRLADEFGLKQQVIAEKVGKSRVSISNTIRLLSLPKNLQNLVMEEKITSGHGRAILSIKDEDKQYQLGKAILDKKLSVRQAERFAKELIEQANTTPVQKTKAELPSWAQTAQEELKKYLSTEVALRHGNSKGKIQIEYYGKEDLERILKIFKDNS